LPFTVSCFHVLSVDNLKVSGDSVTGGEGRMIRTDVLLVPSVPV
jgi:hypothetical protein